MNEFRLEKGKHRGWYTPGISWGYGVGNTVEMIQTGPDFTPKTGDRAVIKIKGAFDWAGVAMEPDYSPTQYLLVEFCTSDWIKVLERITPGHKWRSEVKKLLEKL